MSGQAEGKSYMGASLILFFRGLKPNVHTRLLNVMHGFRFQMCATHKMCLGTQCDI